MIRTHIHRTTAMTLLLGGIIAILFSPRWILAGKMEDVVESIIAFGFDLYGELAKESYENIFFSPYSVSLALAMTWAGAQGKTADEMAATLHFGDSKPAKIHNGFGLLTKSLRQYLTGKEASEISISNALWIDQRYPLAANFQELVTTQYRAMIELVSFTPSSLEETRRYINAQIERDTRERIGELLSKGDIDYETMLVLTNAIYFKGNWLSQFDPKDTRVEAFHLTGGESVQAPIMHKTTKSDAFRYFRGEAFQVLEIPYANGDLVMTVFLPDEHDGLTQLEATLAQNLENGLIQLTPLDDILVLALPKLDFEYRAYIKTALQNLGMVTAFGPEANFCNMFVRDTAWIDKVIHEANITVDETGTEAAAATAVTLKKGPLPIYFRATHPFLFLIRDSKTGVILFLGRVVNPLS
ncbi:serpin family protein [bacterium]|nr:serpin family protein [bacterium]